MCKSFVSLQIFAALCLSLVGCATPDYERYVQAQAQAYADALCHAKPLLKITALPGQQITGMESIEINLPVTAPQVQQSRPNEWASVLGTGLSVAGTVLGIKYAGDAAVRLSDSAGRNAAAGYPYVQAPPAPQANVTNTTLTNTSSRTETSTTQSIGGDGVLGSGVYGRWDATSTPTVVTQPPPVVVTQPPPVVVTQPPPVVVTEPPSAATP